MQVSNIGSNQTEVRFNTGVTILISYSTPVAAFYDGKYYRAKDSYSKTTSKHINQWAGRDAVAVDNETIKKCFKYDGDAEYLVG